MKQHPGLKTIETLHKLQQKAVYKDSKLANRYTSLIRKISMRLRLKLPRTVKRSFCKHCYATFAPGKNCRVRLQGSKVVWYCEGCKNYTRLPYGKKTI